MKIGRKEHDLIDNWVDSHNRHSRSISEAWSHYITNINILRFIPDLGDEDLSSKFMAIRCGKDIHGISINTKGQITFHNHPKIKDEATMWTMAHPILSSHDEKRMKNCLLLYRLVKNPHDFVRYIAADYINNIRNPDWNQNLASKIDPNVKAFLHARVNIVDNKKKLRTPESSNKKVVDIINNQILDTFRVPERKYDNNGMCSNEEEMNREAPARNTWPKAITNRCGVFLKPEQTENYTIEYEKDVVRHRRRSYNGPRKPDTEFISIVKINFSTKNWYKLYKKGLNTYDGYVVLEYIKEARPGYHMVNLATPAKNRTLHVKTALINPTIKTMSWVSNVEAPRIRKTV